jgi:hypothetical protein
MHRGCQWRGGLDRGAHAINGTCQWSVRAPKRERELELARDAGRWVRSVTRGAGACSIRLEGTWMAEREITRSCQDLSYGYHAKHPYK